MRPTGPILILGERLALAIRWLHWTSRYGDGNWPEPEFRKNPDGFAGKAHSVALAKRYGLFPSPAFTRIGLWEETLRLLETNPHLQSQTINIDGLLDELRPESHREDLLGLECFLNAIALGGLTERDLIEL